MNESNSVRSILVNFFSDIGEIGFFASKFFILAFKPPYELSEVGKQMLRLGFKSLFLVSSAAFIIGLVMTIQLIPTMEDYGAVTMVPNMVAVSLIREIGPVLTAIVCAGKVGSAVGAEVAAMKVNDQIDAMSVSGVDPYHYLVVTRVLATTVTIPILIFHSGAIALSGSFLAMNIDGKMSLDLFISSAFDYLFLYDVIPSVIKSVIFGYVIGIIGCYYGYYSDKGTEGVGKAAHSSVVTACLLIFLIDLIVAQITYLFIRNIET